MSHLRQSRQFCSINVSSLIDTVRTRTALAGQTADGMFASSLESCQSKLNIFTNKKIKFPLLFQVRQHSSSTFPRHSPVLSTEIVSSQRANLSDWHQVFVSGWLEIRSLQGVTAIDESLRLHIENINRLLSLSLSLMHC